MGSTTSASPPRRSRGAALAAALGLTIAGCSASTTPEDPPRSGTGLAAPEGVGPDHSEAVSVPAIFEEGSSDEPDLTDRRPTANPDGGGSEVSAVGTAVGGVGEPAVGDEGDPTVGDQAEDPGAPETLVMAAYGGPPSLDLLDGSPEGEDEPFAVELIAEFEVEDGPLSLDAVQRVGDRRHYQVSRCAERADEDPSGSFELLVTIDSDGDISSVRRGAVTTSTEVTECVTREVRRWRFPTESEATLFQVRYRFVVTGP